MALAIIKVCDTCGGDGVVSLTTAPPQEIECRQCDGEGECTILHLKSKKLTDDHSDILDKLDIIIGLLSG